MSATDTSKPERAHDILIPARDRPRTKRPKAKRRRRWLGVPLTVRILAINVLALALLVAGFFYLDRYQRDLMEAKTHALAREAGLVAAALGADLESDSATAEVKLDEARAATLITRLALPADTRVMLFDAVGTLIVDSRRLPLARVRRTELPAPDRGGLLSRTAIAVHDWITAQLPPHTEVPEYVEPANPRAADYPEALGALGGKTGKMIRRTAEGQLIAMVAAPVQPLRRVQGALLLAADADDVTRSVRDVRFTILKAFGIAFGATVVLSLYFAGTITRPVRRLAEAAQRVRAGGGRKATIPDLTARNDEIGRLSAALREMTTALWVRMDAIERFVADVAHEVKNPLSSVRSAVETARRIDDVEKRERLLEIVGEDVQRLDRLLGEITDASRIDTELARVEPEPIDLAAMLNTLSEVQGAASEADDRGISIDVDIDRGQIYYVMGVADRLAQVLQNLLSNARSFSPPGGTVTVSLGRRDGQIVLEVEDEGPGVPIGMEEAIFKRFYTFRPDSEAFGTHSGLGLAISRQIVEAHGGRLTCANRVDAQGMVAGARFTLLLPPAPGRFLTLQRP